MENKKNTITHSNTKFLPNFNGRNKKKIFTSVHVEYSDHIFFKITLLKFYQNGVKILCFGCQQIFNRKTMKLRNRQKITRGALDAKQRSKIQAVKFQQGEIQ